MPANARKTILFFFICCSPLLLLAQQQTPNILFIVADDLGIDVLEGFGIPGEKPVTPVLDSLRASGLAFTNCWATPQCTPTRAAILSGKYGIKTGVMRPPGPLDPGETSIFNRIRAAGSLDYQMAAIGKWHVGGNNNLDHPAEHGLDHYEGVLSSGVTNYFNWTKTTNGSSENVREYATSHFTDRAIEWIGHQQKPWFLWLAHVAPHAPFHAPPAELHQTPTTGTRGRYLAMIEAMDHEIGRLLNSMDAATRNNTIVFFIGDNGTPNPVGDFYPRGHHKGSIYEGGLRVPLIVAGKNVGRVGETETGLVQATDLHATILELLEVPLPGGINNSLSIKPLLECGEQVLRTINYSDYEDDGTLVWATRNEQYKLIEDENGLQEFYDIVADIQESNNLINNLTPAQLTTRNTLLAEAAAIRNGWSCNDGIRNGNETFIDDCGNDCAVTDVLLQENIPCCETPDQPSVFYEFVEGDERKMYSNNYPNHGFCPNNNNPVAQVYRLYDVAAQPRLSGQTTTLIRDNGRPARFFGVALNGIIMMPAPALPFVYENPNTGEYNWDWVFEATNNIGEGRDFIHLDCATAHVNNQGYHYHGNMFAYLEAILPGSTTTTTIPARPIHIGWASDGFPILYRFGPDEDGNMKEMRPSFQLRAGLRPGDGISAPCGPYSGKYTRDYEYVCGKGDLNECNGIEAPVTLPTSRGEETFPFYYVLTSSFPQIPRCLLGEVSPSFANGAPRLNGIDQDGDGFIADFDCNDNNFNINPLAPEIEGNDVDENCDDSLTSVRELSAAGITVGPNPNRGAFWVNTPVGNAYEVRLYAVSGQLVRKVRGSGSLAFRDVASGTYLLSVFSGGLSLGSSKIIVK